jgi:hypothetical protein
MHTRPVKTFCKAALMLITVAIFAPVAIASHVPERFQVVNGVAIYLGVIPGEVLQKQHPKDHGEHKAHGGIPGKGHSDHVLVALFDEATGKRIENAQVMGSIVELGLGVQQKKLEVEEIEGTITYGNYFDLPDKSMYHIKLEIRYPERKGVIKAQFTHLHFNK